MSDYKCTIHNHSFDDFCDKCDPQGRIEAEKIDKVQKELRALEDALYQKRLELERLALATLRRVGYEGKVPEITGYYRKELALIALRHREGRTAR
jgi:hypothetical protein